MHSNRNRKLNKIICTVLALHTRLLIYYQIQTRYKPENSLKIQNISVTLLKATNSALKGKLMFLQFAVVPNCCFCVCRNLCFLGMIKIVVLVMPHKLFCLMCRSVFCFVSYSTLLILFAMHTPCGEIDFNCFICFVFGGLDEKKR